MFGSPAQELELDDRLDDSELELWLEDESDELSDDWLEDDSLLELCEELLEDSLDDSLLDELELSDELL